MDQASQIVTLGAVLLGALTGYLTNYFTERSRFNQALLTRWDGPKLEAYVEYVARVRECIYASVLLFEANAGIRSLDRSVSTLTIDLVDAEGRRALAFERVMLLAGDSVIEAAHSLNRDCAAVDWRARSLTSGDIANWRGLNTAAFATINKFHEAARLDLGVKGRFDGSKHADLGLNLPDSV